MARESTGKSSSKMGKHTLVPLEIRGLMEMELYLSQMGCLSLQASKMDSSILRVC